jgi:hypothetical protein
MRKTFARASLIITNGDNKDSDISEFLATAFYLIIIGILITIMMIMNTLSDVQEFLTGAFGSRIVLQFCFACFFLFSCLICISK